MTNDLRLQLIQELARTESLHDFILMFDYKLKQAGYDDIETLVNEVMNEEDL